VSDYITTSSITNAVYVNNYTAKIGNKLLIYSNPICYTNNDGNHVIVDNKFKKTNEYYKNTNNDISIEIPTIFSEIKSANLIKENFSMNIFPLSQNTTYSEEVQYKNIYNQKITALKYENYFFNNTDLYVSFTEFGFNTEIQFNSKPSKSYIKYKIKVDNAYIEDNNTDYILFKNIKTEEVISIIYYPTISSNKTFTNLPIKIENIEEDIYELTINLESIVNNSHIDYPIKLNQSFHMYKAKQPDTSIYSQSKETGHYLDSKMIIGNDSIRGEGRACIRFETLESLDIKSKDIKSATLILNEISDTKTIAKIKLLPITSYWCSPGLRWDDRPTTESALSSKTIVTTGGAYEFDITDLLKLWLNNKSKEGEKCNIRNGIMLINETPENVKAFASCDNGVLSTVLEIKLK